MVTRRCEATTNSNRRCNNRAEKGSNVCGPHVNRQPWNKVTVRQATKEDYDRLGLTPRTENFPKFD